MWVLPPEVVKKWLRPHVTSYCLEVLLVAILKGGWAAAELEHYRLLSALIFDKNIQLKKLQFCNRVTKHVI